MQTEKRSVWGLGFLRFFWRVCLGARFFLSWGRVWGLSVRDFLSNLFKDVQGFWGVLSGVWGQF